MNSFLLSPPAAFVIVLLFFMLLSRLLSKLSFKSSGHESGAGKAYACGEDVPTHLMQPDYSKFFPFAFFFTILHVVTLMVTTVPVETMRSFSIAAIYIIGAVISLLILFFRD